MNDSNTMTAPTSSEQTPEEVAAQAAEKAKTMIEISGAAPDPRATDQLLDPADLLASLPKLDPSQGVRERGDDTKVDIQPQALTAPDKKATDLNVATLPSIDPSLGVKERGDDTEIPVLHTDVGLVALTGAKSSTPETTETVTSVMVNVPDADPILPSQQTPQTPPAQV